MLSKSLRHTIINKGQNLVDGLGTKRIAKEIKRTHQGNKGDFKETTKVKT